MLRFLLLSLSAVVCLSLSACGASDSLDELLDLVLDPPERETIDVSRLGLNNFFVDPEFGSIPAQYADIQNTLGVNSIRVLFAWSNDVQPTPSSEAFYGFYDDIVNQIPSGMDVIIVLAHAPDWMSNSANWTSSGNPRQTWIDRWLIPTVSRYASNNRIIGWEVWNEPDLPVLPSDPAFGLTAPENYMELLRAGSPAIRNLDPGSLVLNAATESINQDFPNNLEYNRQMVALGALELIDIYNIHYYGQSFERLVLEDGVADFLNGLGKTIWITESGENGPNQQLPYVEETWPFLRDNISGLDRIYYFQYGETGPLETNFGLRTTSASTPLSDLYIHLRDR